MTELVALTAKAFAKNGPVEEALTKLGRPYIINPHQLRYADLTAKALVGKPDIRGLTTLLQGETGVGKTLGYLIPLGLHAARTSTRALISTHTLHLQHQVVRREFDVARQVVKQMTGADISIASQKGRANFVSPSRVQDLMDALKDEKQLSDKDKATLEDLAAFPSGDIREWQETRALPDNIRASDVCLLPGADLSEASAYIAHKEDAQQADVLVVTHALLMLSCINWNTMLGKTEDGNPPFDAAIIDEADRVPSAAESAFNLRIGVPMVERVVQGMEKFGYTGASDAVSEWRDWMDKQFAQMSGKYAGGFRREGAGGFAVLGDARNSSVRDDARNLAYMLVSQLRKGEGIVRGNGMRNDDIEDIMAISNQLQEFAKACDSPGSSYSAPVIRWSPVRTYGSFSLVPLEPGKLTSRLWSGSESRTPYLRTLVMTSATLDAPGSVKSKFFEFREQVGLNAKFHNYNEEGSASIAPDKFGRMDFVFADRRIPKPGDGGVEGDYSNPDWIRYVAAGIQAAQKRGGRSIVLIPSYRDVIAISEAARDLGVDLIEHQQGQKVADLLPAFTSPENPNGVLITPAAWEGVDLPRMIRHVIIPRIPIAAKDNARNRAMLDNYLSRGLDEKKASGVLHMRSNANTRRKMTQGIGRGIRSAEDYVTLWVLDPRFPLPNNLATNRRLRQPNLPHSSYMQYAACIPERFRSGIAATYEEAEIFYAPAAKLAAAE
jgi:ATP-dependent DNA helicase DinG